MAASNFAVELLSTALNRDDLIDVTNLLNHGPASWERSYSPAPALAITTAAVIVRCTGELATVEMVPATMPETTQPDPQP